MHNRIFGMTPHYEKNSLYVLTVYCMFILKGLEEHRPDMVITPER